MKKLAILFLLFSSIISLSAFIYPKYPGYKNLKILPQDITREQMDSVMTHFCISLGVHCNYCHARTEDNTHLDFPSDAKGEKNIARKMMIMTNGINSANFDMGTMVAAKPMVTCYTCHHGQEQPVAAIPDSLLQRTH